jgi:hypothetical protein
MVKLQFILSLITGIITKSVTNFRPMRNCCKDKHIGGQVSYVVFGVKLYGLKI